MKHIKVLVATNQMNSGQFIEELLSSQIGAHVITVNKGSQITDQLRREKYDLLIMDFYLVDCDAFEVFESLKIILMGGNFPSKLIDELPLNVHCLVRPCTEEKFMIDILGHI